MSSVPTTRPGTAAGRAVRPPLDPEAVQRQVLGGLSFTVPKATPPAGYAAAMTGLAACLVLMAVAYAALLLFLAWLAGWHAYQAVASLGYGPYFLFHVPMAVAGGVMLLFLVKPVFFRPGAKGKGMLTLAADEQPLLFAAVDKLCDATGARRPARIEVDCDPNAHARFDKLADSVRGDGALILRIGLPLAAGLSARQLLGVVGHELGHFNQRRGMAGSYLVRRLTFFFARVVFHRDKIDVAVANLRRNHHGAARLAYYAATALVEPMRGVLWLMVQAANLLTAGAQRRMEHDADDVEAHVAGGAEFVRTAKLLVFLDLAHRRARADLANAYATRQLADDLPRLIVANAKQLREHRSDVLKLIDGMRTRWFDSHPCHADRVAHVGRLEAAGLFECGLPASALFADFRGLCRRATDAVYQGVWDADGRAATKVVPTDELAAEQAGRRAAFKVLRRYFRGHVVAGRPMFPVAEKVDAPVTNVPKAAARLGEARQLVEEASDAGGALMSTIRRYVEAAAIVPIARAQLALCSVFGQNPKTRPLAAKARRLLDEHQPALAETTAILQSFEQTGRDRLTLALRLARSGAVADKLPDAAAGRAAVGRLTAVCGAVEAALPAVAALEQVLPAVRMLCAPYNPKQPYPPLVKQIVARSTEVQKQLRLLRESLGDVPYPFAHGTAGVSLAAHVLSKPIPAPKDPVEMFNVASAAVDRYHEVTFRTLAVLSQWAERAEVAAGLPPLTDVPEPADDGSDTAEKTLETRKTRRYWIAYGGRAVAGLVMLAMLVGLSVAPPTIPSFGGGRSDGDYRYRPAAFSVATATPFRAPSSPAYAAADGPPGFRGYQGHTVEFHPGYAPVVHGPGFTPGAFPTAGNPFPPQPVQPNFGSPSHGVPYRPAVPSYTPPPAYTPGRATGTPYAPPTPRVPTPPQMPRPYTPPAGGFGGGGFRGGAAGGRR